MSVFNPDAQWRLSVSTVQPDFSFSEASWPGRYADADEDSDLPDVVLVDPCDVTFGFTDGQVPAQLEPSTLTFNLWARSAADLPTSLQRGTLLQWELTLYPYAPGIPDPVANPDELPVWAVTAGRITEATLQLVPGSRWPARMQVKAVDVLADLPSMTPAVTSGSAIRRKARERLVQIAAAIGNGIGLPTGTPDGANPGLIGGSTVRCHLQWQGNARDQLAAWCTAQDVLLAGIVTPWYDPNLTTYPTGYASCVPAVWSGAVLGNPLSTIKYMVSPSTKPNPSKLPLRLANVGGVLQLVHAPEADQHTAAIDGAVVEVPGVIRSGREHAPNLLRFTGQVEGIQDPVDPSSPLVERAAQADLGVGDWGIGGAGRGPRARQLDTLLELGTWAPPTPDNGNSINAPLATYAAPYVPDAYAVAQAWAFDAVLVRVDKMSVAQARSVVPKLIPSYPVGTGVGEGMDGVLIRHATMFNMDPDTVRPTDPMPQGWVSGGRIHLEAGTLTLEVTITPAAAPSSGSRITVGEVDAASWHAIPAGNIDPSIRVSDLALVDA